MQKGNTKLFINKAKLYEMVNLRICGWAQTSLAMRYSCDRDTIQQQCRKFDIDNEEHDIFNIERIIASVIPKKEEDRFIDFGVIKICKGRDYIDYFKRAYPQRQLKDFIT